MSTVSDDSGAVAALKALEDIRQLKFRYFRILDRGPRDELSDVLSEGIVCDLGDYGRYEGRTAVLDFFQTAVFPTYEMTVHAAHNPEITLLEARAKPPRRLETLSILEQLWTLKRR